MFTEQQIDTVIAYNPKSPIFRKTDAGRVVWYVRNGDVDNLRKLGVNITTAKEYTALKQRVRKKIG